MTRLSATLLLSVAAAAGCRAVSQEQYSATPQRPTLSSDTSTTAHGTFELEAGGTFLDEGNASTPLSLKYGLSETTEVFAGWSPYTAVDLALRDESGPGDLAIGLRHRLRDEFGDEPSLAVQSALKVPTADEDDGLGTGEFDGALAGIATKSLGEWTLTGFAQLDLIGDPAGGVLVGQSLALAASHPLPGDLSVFGELAGVLVPEQDTEQAFTTVGLTFTPTRSLVLDLGVTIGLNGDAQDFGVVVGLTRNLGSGAAIARGGR